MNKLAVSLLEECPVLGLKGICESKIFSLGSVGNVFVVIWKEAPTSEALQSVLAAFNRLLQEHPGGVGMIIVALFRNEGIGPEANRLSNELAKKLASSLIALAMVQKADSIWSRIVHVAMRALMTISRAATSSGPHAASFFATPSEAIDWMLTTLRASGNLNEAAANCLRQGTNWLFQRASRSIRIDGAIGPGANV